MWPRPARLLLAREGDERDVPAPLHGNGDLSLMTGAVSRDASRQDFAPLSDEEPERFYILVIDKGRLVYAEAAHLFPDLEPSPLVASAARPPLVSVASSP